MARGSQGLVDKLGRGSWKSFQVENEKEVRGRNCFGLLCSAYQMEQEGVSQKEELSEGVGQYVGDDIAQGLKVTAGTRGVLCYGCGI